jgi:hypothetical protein
MSNVLATPASPHYGLNQVRGEAGALQAALAAGRKVRCCGQGGQRGVPKATAISKRQTGKR